MLTLLYRWGKPRYRNVRKLAWGSLLQLTLFCKRPTHHPFLSDSFSLLKLLPLRSLWYIKRSFRLFLCIYIYLQLKQFILFPYVTEILLQSWSVFQLYKENVALLVIWQTAFQRQLHQEVSSAKSTAVCSVELTCIKKVFLHLKYPAGREPGCTELHTLSSCLNKNLGGAGYCGDTVFFLSAGMDVWS